MMKIKKIVYYPLHRYQQKKLLNAFNQIRSRFKYSLPTVVVSYPRSGSNFLQNVIGRSSGLPHRSFHQPLQNMKPLCDFGLKSHAISPDWLEDEFSRTTLDYKYPEKIIYVYRDPRDVMISFYEFVQHMKGISLSQDSFIESVSYVYATYTDKDPVLGRSVGFEPMSILDAYKCHYRSWMLREESSRYCLIKYEDLVLQPEHAFSRIFDFLELECSLSADALGAKVSQYDSRSRERGGAKGWMNNQKKYSGIIQAVEEKLSDEIQSLLY